MKRLALALLLVPSLAGAATRTIASGASLLWKNSSSWVEGIVPAASDDVTATVNSGTMTIETSTGCRSIDFTSLTSSFTILSGKTLSIGDATAGVGNNALIFPSSMVLKLGNVATSALSFISTNATAQTVNFNGVTVGNVTFNGNGGSWKLGGTMNSGATAGLILTRGTLDTSSNTLNVGSFNTSGANAKTLVLGTSNITLSQAGAGAWDTSTAPTNITIPVNGSTVTMSGAAATFLASPRSFSGMSIKFTGGGAVITAHNSTFNNVTVNGTAGTSDSVVFDSMTVTGSTSFNGNSASNRLLVNSGTVGTPGVITNTGATDNSSNADFQDITYSSALNLSAIAGKSGDCGGNSGITFTTPATQTWANATGGTWSTAGNWTSRVPLCQDNVSFAFALNTGVTITADEPRLGANVDWTGMTFSGTGPTFAGSGNIYGSYTLLSTINSYTALPVMVTRTASTLTTGGKDMKNFTIAPVGGTVTLQDNLFIATNLSNLLNVKQSGTFNANGKSVTIGGYTLQGSATLNLGGGAWTLTNDNTVLNVTGGSMIVSGSSITIASTANFSKGITGGGLHYGTIGVLGGALSGTFTVSDSNTIDSLVIGAPKTIQITFSRTLTLGALSISSSSGNVVTFNTNSAGNAATISIARGNVCMDWLSLKDTTATGGANFYAGANSTFVSGVTGWILAACPPAQSWPLGAFQ